MKRVGMGSEIIPYDSSVSDQDTSREGLLTSVAKAIIEKTGVPEDVVSSVTKYSVTEQKWSNNLQDFERSCQINKINHERMDLGTIATSLYEVVQRLTGDNSDDNIVKFKQIASQIKHFSIDGIQTVFPTERTISDTEKQKYFKTFLSSFTQLESIVLTSLGIDGGDDLNDNMTQVGEESDQLLLFAIENLLKNNSKLKELTIDNCFVWCSDEINSKVFNSFLAGLNQLKVLKFGREFSLYDNDTFVLPNLQFLEELEAPNRNLIFKNFSDISNYKCLRKLSIGIGTNILNTYMIHLIENLKNAPLNELHLNLPYSSEAEEIILEFSKAVPNLKKLSVNFRNRIEPLGHLANITNPPTHKILANIAKFKKLEDVNIDMETKEDISVELGGEILELALCPCLKTLKIVTPSADSLKNETRSEAIRLLSLILPHAKLEFYNY